MSFKKFVAVAMLIVAPVVASAHSSVKSDAPKDGETLAAAPGVVRLNFGDAMRITVLKLTGPAGEVPLVRTDGLKPVTTIEAAPDGEMVPGAYEIEWRGMGADSHIMEGTVDFTIAQ